MERRLWRWYLMGGVGLTLLYLFGPGWANIGSVFNAIGASAPLAILMSTRVYRPDRRAPWLLFALGQALFVGGDVIAYNYQRFFDAPLPYPAISDVFYLSVYPCLIAGLLLLIRRPDPGRDRSSLIDSLIIAVGAGVLSWVFLMAPYVHDPSLTLLQKMISVAYPLMDLLLLAVVARLAVGSGRRQPAFYLLVASVVCLLATDAAYGWILLNVEGGYVPGGLLDGGWAIFYLLWGAAALHPSVRSLSEPEARQESQHDRARLAFLAVTALMTPAVLVIRTALRQPVDAYVIAIGSAVLFLLVLARVADLMVNISEHKRTETLLREAESRYRTLVEHLPVVSYSETVKADTISYYMSPQIEVLLGYPPQEWTGQPSLWRNLVHPDDRDRIIDAHARSDETGEPFAEEYRMRMRDGRWVWVRDEAVLVAGSPGESLFWQGVLSDVTERRQAEVELRRSFDRLRASDETRRKLLARLVSAQEEERQRIAGDIHDDPLQKVAAVSLRLGTLRMKLTDPTLLALVEQLQQNVDVAIERLRNLLFELRPHTLDTGGLADALNEYIQQPGSGDGIEYSLENQLVDEPVGEVRDIAYRITQEALNNVRKHARAKKVDVLLQSRDGGVFIRVRDDGVGMSLQNVDGVLPGHLGLTSMRERAELAGGSARISSAPGAGTTIEFWLPSGAGSPAPRPLGTDASPVA
ncbi:MAG: PAS domain-containing protein [Actinobacteria bacterium]|nr:PAS domain-containing protein [Actinomycetota bacterium]